MQLQLFKTLWGHQGSYDPAAQAAQQTGFQGLEGPIPSDPDTRSKFLACLQEYRLLYIAEISTTGFAVPDPGSTVEQHLDAFERILVDSLDAQPLFFSCMGGSDLWSFADNVTFLTKAWQIAQSYHVRVGFETHRSRSLFHPIVTQNLLAETPPIELTIDFSHWCNVCERLVLDELPDILQLCAQRVLHIQPRVGYDQGAQVPDPRAPMYQAPLQAHLRWWKILWQGQQQRGFTTTTLTPEFGPDGYQQVDPYTKEPTTDLWQLNTWMGKLLKKEFTQFMGT